MAVTASAGSSPRGMTREEKKVIFASSLGTVFEWYDFYLYGSLAAAAFVPAMLLGILWRGANRTGAAAGMLAGLGITVYYMLANAPAFRAFWGWPPGQQLWFGIQPLSAAVFGVPVGFAVTWGASLLGRRTLART